MTKSSDRRERDQLQEAFASLGEDARPRPDCPPPATLWAAAHGEADHSTTGEILDHLARCPLCREAWALADELSRRHGKEQSGSLPSSPPFGRALGAVAAVILMVLVVSLLWRSTDRPPPPPTERGHGEELLTLEAVTSLPRDAFTLHWQGPSEEATFHLRLSHFEEGKRQLLLQERELTEEGYTVPAEKLAAVPEGGTVLVYIEALEEGTVVASRSLRVTVE